MTDVFAEALRRTLYHEGGYSNDPHDPGGATKFGVSLRFLKGLGKLGDIDHDGDVDQDDVLAVANDPTALSKLYYDNFWVPSGCPRIYSDLLQIKLFDTAVNAGPKRAQMFLQHAYNLLPAIGSTIAEDGVLGTFSIAAINGRINVDSVMLTHYRGIQSDFYSALIKNDTTLSAFSLGWVRRAMT